MESARNMYVILCRFHLFSLFKASWNAPMRVFHLRKYKKSFGNTENKMKLRQKDM